MRIILVTTLFFITISIVYSQTEETTKELPKVLHAEPLYIDLIRDLGARKGEREWNIGYGLTDFLEYDEYELLVEYEFAAWDRLGIEFEVPLKIHTASDTISAPPNTIEALQAALQWTFLVNENRGLSLALGYLNELLVTPFEEDFTPIFEGNLFNPLFVGAKRLGLNWHSLIYTGPKFEFDFNDNTWHNEFELHLNFHYMVPNTSNFVGLEINQYFENDKYDLTLRPQLRVDINENLLIGMVTGIPMNNPEERLSFFLRIIFEPESHL